MPGRLLRLVFGGVAAALLLVAGPAAAQDRPFGFEMGQQRSEMLPKRAPDAPVSWTYGYGVDAPEPDPEFRRYSVTAPPDHGTCYVQAMGIPRTAVDADAAFERMVEKITRDYGPPRRVDPVRPPDNPHLSVPPVRSAYWAAPSGGLRGSDVAGVSLWATYGGVSYLSIDYDFTNGCPEHPSNWRAAVITVRVTRVGAPYPSEPCVKLGRVDCPMVIDSSFAGIRILTGELAPAGEPVPTGFDYTTWADTEWKPGETIVMLLSRREDEYLFIRDWSAPKNGRACLNVEQLEIERIAAPGPVVREGKDHCFRVPD